MESYSLVAARAMSSTSPMASMPAKPPPTKTKVSMRLRSSASHVDAAMASWLSTRLRSAVASSMCLKPMPISARPGIGSTRATEPRPTTRWS